MSDRRATIAEVCDFMCSAADYVNAGETIDPVTARAFLRRATPEIVDALAGGCDPFIANMRVWTDLTDDAEVVAIIHGIKAEAEVRKRFNRAFASAAPWLGGKECRP